MSTETHQPHSIIGLLQSLRDETTTLLRQEVALAKAELSDKGQMLGQNVAKLAVAGILALLGAIVLLFGVADLVGYILIKADLDPPLAMWLSRIVVGAVVAAIGWILLAKAKKAFSAESLTPRQTLDSLQENKQWAQNKLHQSQ